MALNPIVALKTR